MARDNDVVRNHGTLFDAGFLWMTKASSALISAFKYFVSRPFKSETEKRSVARTQAARLEGNLTLARLLRAGRIVFFPVRLGQLWMLGFLSPYVGHVKYPDRFCFLAHNHYLSKNFTLRQRTACAISHYRHERRSCGSAYHESVYHSPEGLTLWHREVSGTRYSLRLRATEDVRREGDLSILCLVDDVRVCRLSFSYVQGSLFGIDTPITLFVTRNQTDRNTELQQFRADFKQNSPQYFCVAAVCGIAMAHGLRQICLIQDEAQVAYDPRYAQNFKNSYSEFWRAFGAKLIPAINVHTMLVPPEFNPIATVKHKARAGARRQNWLEIMVNARHAILEDRLTRSPVPIDVETSSLLRTSASN